MNKWIPLLMVGLMWRALDAGAVPLAIPYQGVLTEVVNGQVTNMTAKTANLEVRLYGVPTGGTALWGRLIPATLDHGAFNVELSDLIGSPLGGGTLQDAFANSEGPLYLGLKVAGSEEITPRQQMLSTAYAVVAQTVRQSVGDFQVNGKLTVVGKAEIAQNLALSNTLSVAGNAQFNSWVLFKNGMTVQGAPATFNANVEVNAPATISGYGTIPLGGIILWSGATNQIPDGWALCDGRTVNGRTTPDLRGRFVVGVGSLMGDTYNVGGTGGTNKVKLTVAEMPSHSHATYKYTSTPFWGASNLYWTVWIGTASNQTSITGGDQPHENRPPYHVLAYIMRVK